MQSFAQLFKERLTMTKIIFTGIILLFHIQAGWTQEQLHVSLQQLFEIADKNNQHLKILSGKEQVAIEGISLEKQKQLPTVNASLALSYNSNGWISDRDFSNGFSVPIPAIGNNFALEAQQLIYGGGAVKTAIALAETNLQLAKLETQTNRQNIRFAITGYYLELLKLSNQRKILDKNIAQTEKLVEQIKTKTKEGVALKNSITRYELQLQSMGLSLLKLDNSVTIINNELVKTLRLPQGTSLQPKGEDAFTGTLQNKEYWQTTAHSNSPLLQQSLLQTGQAKRYEQLVKAEKSPQVFAFASDYLNGPVMIEIPVLDNNFNYWNVGVGIRYPISSLYKHKAKARQANVLTQNSLQYEQLVKDQLENDIEAANIRYQETIKVCDTHLKGVELAKQNYEVVRNRYLNDMVLTTEMLDAENTRLDAEMQAANAEINILFHYYLLKKLTGTL